jgi:uncharacterized lipoprotein YddW (UPF0748 family)
MTRALRLVAAACALSAASGAQVVDAALRAEPPAPPRELRAAWVATVDHIDWPSRRGMTVAQQQEELRAILDRARDLRLNALLLQVRPSCDALYSSSIEPWSEWLTGAQGRAPEPLWDPLQFAIDGARARGIELHAWFNPFRARHEAAKSPEAPNHVSRTPGLSVKYGKEVWLDPGNARAREHVLRVIFDVVERYDIDGVCIDDYFYPYPVAGQEFDDRASYARYRAEGGALERGDWRRANVDGFIERLYAGIKDRKSWVKFGISPFGIARPGVPAGIVAGLDQYTQLFADVRKWLAHGWADYFAPQLYWRLADRGQSYRTLLDWWGSQNPKGRHLWIANYASQTLRKRDPWPANEIVDQIRTTRENPRTTGNIHFSMKALLDPSSQLARALELGSYVEPALVPASPWLDAVPPAPPEVDVESDGAGGVALRWPADPDVRWRTIYLLCSGRWRMVQVLPGSAPGLRITADDIRGLRVGGFAVGAVDRCGNESERVRQVLP